MKKLVSFEKELGGDGAKAAGSIGVSGASVVAQVEVNYPLEKVLEPALKVVDNMIDKIEKLIPGDQTVIAANLKKEAREELVKLLSESQAE